MSEQFIVFKLSGEEFGVSISKVQEIVNVQAVTPIPHSEFFIKGIINLRGVIVPIVDLGKKFGRSREAVPDGEAANEKIIILALAAQKIGVLVDDVSEILTVDESALEKPPILIARQLNTAFIGQVAKVGERLILILDLDKTFSEEEMSHFIEASAL